MSQNRAMEMLDAEVPTNALDMISRLGIDKAATEGYGPSYIRDAMLAAMPTIRRNLNQGNEQLGVSRDLAFSGADSGVFDKQAGEIAAGAVSGLGQVVYQAEAENEARKGQAQGMQISALSSYDAMVNQRAMAKAEFEASKLGWSDYLFKGLTTAAAFV